MHDRPRAAIDFHREPLKMLNSRPQSPYLDNRAKIIIRGILILLKSFSNGFHISSAYWKA